MMRKLQYELRINKTPRQGSFTLGTTYGSTGCFTITIAKQAISISVSMGVKYSSLVDVLTSKNRLFTFALKMAMTIHLLRYSERLIERSASLWVNGNQIDDGEFCDESLQRIYSLLDDNSSKAVFPTDWNSSDLILNTMITLKNGSSNLQASMNAYIQSKFKKYVVEKFMYQWMAVNGLYSELTAQIKKAQPQSNIRKEWQQIMVLLQFIKEGDRTVNNEKHPNIFKEIKKAILKESNYHITKASLSPTGTHKDLFNRITNELGTDYSTITPYGYLLLLFCYKFRCEYFHAGKPVPLLSYKDEADLFMLSALNSILEEFLDIFIPRFMNYDYMNSTVIPFAQSYTLQ